MVLIEVDAGGVFHGDHDVDRGVGRQSHEVEVVVNIKRTGIDGEMAIAAEGLTDHVVESCVAFARNVHLTPFGWKWSPRVGSF